MPKQHGIQSVKKIWKNGMVTNMFFPKLSLITVFDERILFKTIQ